jgi:drug/metabolite transporter (DMT)-like permease
VALAAGAVLLVPFAIATWDVDGEAWAYIAASVVLELAYFALLARAYSRADLAFVYPVARGAGPVLVVAGSVLFVGLEPAALELLGVGLVVAGVALVRRLPPGGGSRDLALALAVGACIAGYTIVDDRGIEHAAAVPYLACVLVPSAAGLLAIRRPPRAAVNGKAMLAGAGMAGAYLLTLAALEKADPGAVAAVREASIVMAVAFAALAGRERVGRARAAGAAVVVAGVAALALAG